MKNLYCLVIGVLAGIILGILLPWRLCSECSSSILDVCHHCFWDWALRVLQVIGTLGAVIVALFKEWLYRKIYHPSFVVTPSTNDVLEEIDDCNNVSQYYSELHIKNDGSASASNCELYMSSLVYISSNGSIRNTLLNVDNSILWNSTERRIDIPKSFSQTVEWFKVIRGIPQSGSNSAVPAQLIIGNKQINKQMHNGTFEVVFKVVSQGTDPKEVKLRLSWDGRWQDHKAQMVTGLQYYVMA